MKKISFKILGIILVVIILSYNNIVIAAQTQQDLKNEQQANQNEIKENEKKIEEVKEIKDETLKEVEKITNEILSYESQISELNEKITETTNRIAEEQENLKQAEQDYEKQEKALKTRLVAIYKAGETSYLDYLFSSKSLVDFISNYYYASEIASRDTEMLDKIQKKKEEIEKAKQDLENSKKELDESKASKQQVSNQLQSSKKDKDAYVAKLSEDEKTLQARIEELNRDNQAIDAQIKAMQKKIEEERRRQEELNKQNNSSGSNNSSSNSGTSSAGFIRPVNSYVTGGMYYSDGRYHGAVDFGASGINGAPIYAVADGIVVTTQSLTTSYGNYIILYHPSSNLYTLYAHGQAGSIAVSTGQSVKQGQQIMRVGSTGNSSGPHLHFEVRTYPGLYANRVNPMNYLP